MLLPVLFECVILNALLLNILLLFSQMSYIIGVIQNLKSLKSKMCTFSFLVGAHSCTGGCQCAGTVIRLVGLGKVLH